MIFGNAIRMVRTPYKFPDNSLKKSDWDNIITMDSLLSDSLALHMIYELSKVFAKKKSNKMAQPT